MRSAWGPLVPVCVLVIGVYAYVAQSGLLESLSRDASDTYYNLLVRGFQQRQLNLDKEVPPGLTNLADPYDPVANAPYRLLPWRLHDLSYYKGRLYLYHGVTPALIMFWPFAALTGQYMFHRQAALVFCSIAFLAIVWLLYAVWRRYLVEVSVWVVAVCAVALGLATGVPVLLSRVDVYEVPISCAYMLAVLTLGAIWRAVHEPKRRCQWLAMASVAYGLAVGARPSMLFGAVVLLVPVVQGWLERQRVEGLLTAAIGPILLIGLGLLYYNVRRFDDPLEFGVSYLLAGDRPGAARSFSPAYLWFNFRLYFLKSAGWSREFPFMEGIVVPPLPLGHGNVESALGILADIPLAWLALTVPAAWWRRSSANPSMLGWFATAVALLFVITATTICLYYYTAVRYEVEFVPVLLLLAVIGVLGLEHALRGRPTCCRAVRCVWCGLLGLSVVFNLLACVEYHAEAHHVQGVTLFQEGNVTGATEQYRQALRLYPHYTKAHLDLGIALEKVGRVPEAVQQYRQALRLNPDYVKERRTRAVALEQTVQSWETFAHR
jgi:tetratricopeptide (TPR) repeat protein